MAANALHSQRFSAAFHHGPPGLLAFVVTTDDVPINKLIWQTAPARVEADGTLAAPQPSANVRVFSFTATTPAGLRVSSPAVIAVR